MLVFLLVQVKQEAYVASPCLASAIAATTAHPVSSSMFLPYGARAVQCDREYERAQSTNLLRT